MFKTPTLYKMRLTSLEIINNNNNNLWLIITTTMTNIHSILTMQETALQHFAILDGSLIYSNYLVVALLTKWY